MLNNETSSCRGTRLCLAGQSRTVIRVGVVKIGVISRVILTIAAKFQQCAYSCHRCPEQGAVSFGSRAALTGSEIPVAASAAELSIAPQKASEKQRKSIAESIAKGHLHGNGGRTAPYHSDAPYIVIAVVLIRGKRYKMKDMGLRVTLCNLPYHINQSLCCG